MKKYTNSYLSYFLMYGFFYLSWALFAQLTSVYLLGKGYNATEVSLVVSCSYFTSMVMQPIIGSFSDRYSVRKVMTVLFVLAGFGGIAFMLANSLITIIIGYCFVLTLINGTVTILEKVATTSPYRYGSIRIWGTIGYASGSQIAGILYDKISPSAIFIVFFVTMLIATIGLIGTRPKLSQKEDTQTKENVKTITLFTNKKYLYYLVICGLFSGVASIGNTYIPSMLNYSGLAVSITSTVLSVAVICEAPIVFFSHKFMDRFANKTLITISFILIMIQYGTYGFNLGLPLMVAGTFLAKHTAGMLLAMTNLKVVNTIVNEKQQITALAFIATFKNLCNIVFQNVGGRVLDMTSYPTLFKILFGILALGLVLVFFFKIESGNDKQIFN